MQESNEDEWSDEEVMSLVQTLTKHAEVSAEELQTLLSLRQKKRVDFVLVDIREVYEYTNHGLYITNQHQSRTNGTSMETRENRGRKLRAK